MVRSHQLIPFALNTVYTVAAPFVWNSMRKKARLRGYSTARMKGFFTRNLPTNSPGYNDVTRCWLHAVSVGESIAAGALFKELKKERRQWDYLVTTATETGQRQARESLRGADRFAFAPYDHSLCVNRFLNHYRPSLYCFFETEFWPNLLLQLQNRSTPVFLVNGKLSEKSAKNYRRYRAIFRPALHAAQHYYMQTQQDAERLESIIGKTTRITVSGNLKFDALPHSLLPQERAELRACWGINDSEILIIAGSTHPREEELLLQAWKQAKESVPNLRLALVPRHPERFSEVEALIQAQGELPQRTSALNNTPPGNAVLLGDEMGRLSTWFGASDLAVVGGAWNPIGGHNLLEPAIHGVPVIRGPHMHAQPDIVRVLTPQQGGLMIEEHELTQSFIKLAQNHEYRKQLGAAAQSAAQSCKGAANRVAKHILALTNQHSSSKLY
ncbi:MAG: 3-deoxy-D-manno-octulosonic acid transferase [Sumerlaeia bacterium]